MTPPPPVLRLDADLHVPVDRDDPPAALARAGVAVEVTERWRTPGVAVARALAAAGVPLVAGSATVDPAGIARWAHTRQVAAALRPATTPPTPGSGPLGPATGPGTDPLGPAATPPGPATGPLGPATGPPGPGTGPLRPATTPPGPARLAGVAGAAPGPHPDGTRTRTPGRRESGVSPQPANREQS